MVSRGVVLNLFQRDKLVQLRVLINSSYVTAVFSQRVSGYMQLAPESLSNKLLSQLTSSYYVE